MPSFLYPFIILSYIIAISNGSPNTTAEIGNEIEKLLLESNSVKEVIPKNKETSSNYKKPDEFMEDLIEVQRTFRNLKEKWQRMIEEKTRAVQMNSDPPAVTPSTPATSSTSPVPSKVKQIEIDVFEAPDKFQDISMDIQKNELDEEAISDVPATSSASALVTTETSRINGANEANEEEENQAQAAIQEVIRSNIPKVPPPRLFTAIGPTTKAPETKEQQQIVALATGVKGNQTTLLPTGPVKTMNSAPLPAKTTVSLRNLSVPTFVTSPTPASFTSTMATSGPSTEQSSVFTILPRAQIHALSGTSPEQPKAKSQSKLHGLPLEPVVLGNLHGADSSNLFGPIAPPPQTSIPPDVQSNSTLMEKRPVILFDSTTLKQLQARPGPLDFSAVSASASSRGSLSSTFGTGENLQNFLQNVTSPTPSASTTSSESFTRIITSSEVPLTLFTTSPASTRASSPELPSHVLPTSSFVSSGSNPNALPATNLFRYPDKVNIPFFGGKPQTQISNSKSVGSSGIFDLFHSTTPEPFRSEEDEQPLDEMNIVNVKDFRSSEHDSSEAVEESESKDDELESSEDIGEEEKDIEEITASDESENAIDFKNSKHKTTPHVVKNNEDYIEETFDNENSGNEKIVGSESVVPDSFDILKSDGVVMRPRSKAFGVVPRTSESGDPSSGVIESHQATSRLYSVPSNGSPLWTSTESEKSGAVAFGAATSGSAPGSSESSPPMLDLLSAFSRAISAPSYGIGRSPPGSSSTTVPTLHPPAKHSALKSNERFPTLVQQVEETLNRSDAENGLSSALGSFGELAEIGSVPVHQSLQVIEPHQRSIEPLHSPTSKTRGIKSREPIGIFETKLKDINDRATAYNPMFPASLETDTVQMVQPENSFFQRTAVSPIGPHGLAEPKDVINSVNMELPAWGMNKNYLRIMGKASREYQKEFEQQIRDVRMTKNAGRSKASLGCGQIFAHTLSLPRIQKMSYSLGLGDVAIVLQEATDLTENKENDIAKLEVNLDKKRKLIAKMEILLSLSESRATLFDLLKKQKKLAGKMENYALDLLRKTDFPAQTPSPFSAASDLSELTSAVREVLRSNPKQGRATMWKKLHTKSQLPNSKLGLLGNADVAITNNFAEFHEKHGHLQETAEIVEPVLPLSDSQKDQFGRDNAIYRRLIPLAPPTLSPTARPAQRAAHQVSSFKPIPPPEQDDESETVHDLIDMLHEDIVKLPVDVEEKICRQVECGFERGDLCNFESSHDETTRLRYSQLHSQLRQKRVTQLSDDLLAQSSNIADHLLRYTFRSWSIWAGRRAEKSKQIDIGPIFSSLNRHFSAVFVEPLQAGILSLPLVLSPTSTRIRLRLFEGTRGIRLRVCCDRYCPLETEQGMYRGHRSWLKKTVTCPPNTQTLSFECLNDGPGRGACGVDDIFVDSTRCYHFFDGSDQN